MTRGKKPSHNDLLEWLRWYEAGQTLNQIARRAKRDVRTIAKGLELARNMRRVNEVQIGILKSAIEAHQIDLINALDDLQSSVSVPPLDMVIPWQYKEGDVIDLGRATAVLPIQGGQSIKFNSENKLIFTLLKEHLKDDPMWNQLDQWKQALSDHINARLDLKRICADDLKEQTGCGIVSDKELEQPFIYSYTGLEIVYDTVIARILGHSAKPDYEKRLNINYDVQEVRYGPGSSMAYAPGLLKKCRDGFVSVVRDLPESDAGEIFLQTYNDLQTVTHITKELIEEVRLANYIPRSCKVCSRITG